VRIKIVLLVVALTAAGAGVHLAHDGVAHSLHLRIPTLQGSVSASQQGSAERSWEPTGLRKEPDSTERWIEERTNECDDLEAAA
jgi:hypothetical protein